MRFGYARCSTSKQHTDGQEARLRAEGCEEVFTDTISGAAASRPAWDQLFAKLRKGDELVVTKLDRLGRSLTNLIDIVNELGTRGVNIRCLDRGEIDTTTAAGELIFGIFALLAQWERRLISERTVEGLAAAKERHGGKLPGRKRSLTDDQIALAKRLWAERDTSGMSAQRIAQLVGCSRGHLYEILKLET